MYYVILCLNDPCVSPCNFDEQFGLAFNPRELGYLKMLPVGCGRVSSNNGIFKIQIHC